MCAYSEKLPSAIAGHFRDDGFSYEANQVCIDVVVSPTPQISHLNSKWSLPFRNLISIPW
jgi:hypothetical protein